MRATYDAQRFEHVCADDDQSDDGRLAGNETERRVDERRVEEEREKTQLKEQRQLCIDHAVTYILIIAHLFHGYQKGTSSLNWLS